MERVIEHYYALHQIPEIGFCEYKTKKYIVSILSDLNCRIHEIGNCGLIAYFDFDKKNTIGLRCELDALPIEEFDQNIVISSHVGYMHACGHDAHMAILLTLAEYINENGALYNVLLIFQSGEELYGGALEMVDSGCIQSYQPFAIFGMHVWPGLSYGRLYSREGGILAGSDEIDIKICGKSSHVADSCLSGNALLCASDFLVSFYDSFSSKEWIGRFGVLRSGSIRNASSDLSHLMGTLRYFDKKYECYGIESIEDLLSMMDSKWGTKSQILVNPCNSPVINSKELYERIKCGISLSKCDSYFQSEDFGIYSSICPTLYLLLGCGDRGARLHNSDFWVDEEIVLFGLSYYKQLLNCFFA